MRHNTILSIIAGLGLLIFSTTIYAQPGSTTDVPRTISYQGLLTSADGAALHDGTHSITVTLYADEAGTQVVWRDSYEAPTTKGVFNLYLGSKAPLPSPLQLNRPLWVGTSVNGAEEMRPLTPLTSSPYALNLPDHAVTTDKLADGAVTADKVEMDYVAGFRVNGEEIAGKGTVLNLVGTSAIPVTYDSDTRSLTIGRLSNQSSNDEKGANALAGGPTLWSVNGDGYDVSTSIGYTPASGDWIGTKGNTDFSIHVNNSGLASGGNQRVMRYIPNGTSANILGGHNSNTIGTGIGNVIAGGGNSTSSNGITNGVDYGVVSGGEGNVLEAGYSHIGGGKTNRINNSGSTYSFIGGGIDNTIGDNTTAVTTGVIAGGGNNTLLGQYGLIGGGSGNEVTSERGIVLGGLGNKVEGERSVVLNGWSNDILAAAGSLGDGQQSIIGTGIFNKIYDSYSFIGTGGSNRIEVGANNSAVVSGNINWIYREFSFIGSGYDHRIETPFSTIVGGINNWIQGGTAQTVVAGNFIGSGERNNIYGLHNGVVGGKTNSIGDVVEEDENHFSFIGGGLANAIHSDYSSIAGGQDHQVKAPHSGILSGNGNIIDVDAPLSAITGGDGNHIEKEHGFVGGGTANSIESSYSSIIGGMTNSVSGSEEIGLNLIGTGSLNNVHGFASSIVGGSQHKIGSEVEEIEISYSVIGGGYENEIYADYAAIVGGESNLIESSPGPTVPAADYAFIGGGLDNTNGSVGGGIVAGKENQLTNGATGGTSDYSFIGGGRLNYIKAIEAVIGGGLSNEVSGIYSVVGGGHRNVVKDQGAVINGGFSNTTEALYSTIGGGSNNLIEVDADRSLIAGGGFSVIQHDAGLSTIGGGSNNYILSTIIPNPDLLHATIPGGDNLVAQSWAQTVIGGYNVPKGSVSSRYLAGGNRNNPIFIIGNGDHLQRSNGFEVSYNGHSIVYDENGSGGWATMPGRGAVEGGTYTDNVIYGWAEVGAGGQILNSCADFGIQSIQNPSQGVYVITLKPVGPDGSTPVYISCGAAVATLGTGMDPNAPFNPETDFPCRKYIVTTNIKNNVFKVYIGQYDPRTDDCLPSSAPFKFHVTGRPSNTPAP